MIPKQRMKGRNPHVVCLSRQALDIFVSLHACAAGGRGQTYTPKLMPENVVVPALSAIA